MIRATFSLALCGLQEVIDLFDLSQLSVIR